MKGPHDTIGGWYIPAEHLEASKHSEKESVTRAQGQGQLDTLTKIASHNRNFTCPLVHTHNGAQLH